MTEPRRPSRPRSATVGSITGLSKDELRALLESAFGIGAGRAIMCGIDLAAIAVDDVIANQCLK